MSQAQHTGSVSGAPTAAARTSQAAKPTSPKPSAPGSPRSSTPTSPRPSTPGVRPAAVQPPFRVMAQPVIVVGAGVSGLSAARLLRKHGEEVIVLEARNRVGGRTYTIQNPDVGYMDYGGAYIGATQNYLLRMLQDLKLDQNLYSVYVENNFVMMLNKKRYLFKADGEPFFWNFLNYLDIVNFFRKLDLIGETIPSDAPWDTPNAEELDRTTYKEFVEKTCWTKTAKEYAEFFIQINVTSEPYEASLLWFAWYVKQCGGVKRIVSVKGGGQEMKLKNGMQQVSIKMAQELGHRIKLSSPVVSITTSNDGVVARTLSGVEYKGTRVVFALAPSMQAKIHIDPPLPPYRNQMIQRMPMGSVWKLQVFYKEAWWRKLGYSGAVMCTPSETYSPVVYTIDDTKPDGSYPSIIGFMPADRARKLNLLTKQQRLEMCKQTYAKAFKSDLAYQHVHYEEFNWSEEQYSGGCYTSMCPPGVLTVFKKTLRDPIGLIHFAGTETATEWSGYINGAIQSGERAAKEILFEMGKITREQLKAPEPPNHRIPVEFMYMTTFERYVPSVGCLVSIASLGAIAGGAFCIYRHVKYGWVPSLECFRH